MTGAEIVRLIEDEWMQETLHMQDSLSGPATPTRDNWQKWDWHRGKRECLNQLLVKIKRKSKDDKRDEKTTECS